MTRRTLGFLGWILLLASVFALSCGAAFHTGVDDEGAGGEPEFTEAGAGPGAGGGGASSGPLAGAAGATNEGGAAGAGGDGDSTTCAELGGVEREEDGSCYVDVTPVISPTQAEAVAACDALADELGRSAHLLVLNDLAEQDFILLRFLAEFTNVSDAWLGLTCTAEAHPNVEDCYCKDCADTELAQKQEAWSWLDGSTNRFGWVNGNPNAAGRCAALGYNPTPGVNERWGWVDRPCEQGTVTPVQGNTHGYRALCEVGR